MEGTFFASFENFCGINKNDFFQQRSIEQKSFPGNFQKIRYYDFFSPFLWI